MVKTICSCFNVALQQLNMNRKHDTIAATHKVCVFPSPVTPQSRHLTVLTTLDSGADRQYLSEQAQVQANLPILRPSTKCVGFANGECSKAKHVTSLPLPYLSPQATQADSLDDFPSSLISV